MPAAVWTTGASPWSDWGTQALLGHESQSRHLKSVRWTPERNGAQAYQLRCVYYARQVLTTVPRILVFKQLESISESQGSFCGSAEQTQGGETWFTVNRSCNIQKYGYIGWLVIEIYWRSSSDPALLGFQKRSKLRESSTVKKKVVTERLLKRTKK